MSLLIIRLRLATYLALFAAELVGIYLRHIQPLIWSVGILGVLVIGLGHTFFSMNAQVKLEAIQPVSLATTIPHQEQLFSRAQLELQLSSYQELLKTQPKHKDILVNIALLQRALHNQKEAYISWEEARKLDPNNPTFTTSEVVTSE